MHATDNYQQLLHFFFGCIHGLELIDKLLAEHLSQAVEKRKDINGSFHPTTLDLLQRSHAQGLSGVNSRVKHDAVLMLQARQVLLLQSLVVVTLQLVLVRLLRSTHAEVCVQPICQGVDHRPPLLLRRLLCLRYATGSSFLSLQSLALHRPRRSVAVVQHQGPG
jgi:hypothetical protein